MGAEISYPGGKENFGWKGTLLGQGNN